MRLILQNIGQKVNMLLAAFLGTGGRADRASDITRWKNEASLSPRWDSRTSQLAALIPPGMSVLEFGAGRMMLRHYLPEGCVYTPSDLVEREAGVIVCDLNAERLPVLPWHDVVVFSGVLEYVNDLPRLVAFLAGQCCTVIMSYSTADCRAWKWRFMRRARGWVNHYASRDLKDMFWRNGFVCEREELWQKQTLYKFVRAQAIVDSKNSGA